MLSLAIDSAKERADSSTRNRPLHALIRNRLKGPCRACAYRSRLSKPPSDNAPDSRQVPSLDAAKTLPYRFAGGWGSRTYGDEQGLAELEAANPGRARWPDTQPLSGNQRGALSDLWLRL